MHVLETSELRHRFTSRAASNDVLSGISLRVPEGSIYGFLGPNGAGKTTTLRLILGLLKRQHGTIRVFGRAFEADRLGILRRLGSMIETPSLYDHLTAHENLRILQLAHRCDPSRIGEVLEVVGLGAVGSKRVKQFSLGMRQRLGIAGALLHRPSLLILDEPTNGLDPHGILEMRGLLQQLNREQGVTIVVSSHLLSEIERLATHVGILGGGKLLFQGTIDELRQKRQEVIEVRLATSDDVAATQVIAAEGITVCVDAGELVLPPLEATRIAAINRKLLGCGLEVYELRTVRNDLETIFMNLVESDA
jgi:ABC-type multidrug transport system ATPase subunit